MADPVKKPETVPPLGVDGQFPCIVWDPIRCPRCSSRDVWCDGVKETGLRYYDCRSCGLRFKCIPKEGIKKVLDRRNAKKVRPTDSG